MTRPRPDPIAEQLRDERQRRHLSQREVCDTAGFDHARPSLTCWETGARVPLLTNARDWARALGYDLVLQPIAEKKEQAQT